MKKVLYYLLLAVLIGVFAFSAYKIGSYLVEKHKSEQVTKAAEEFTTPVETDEEQTTKEPERISVDFDALRQQNGDVVAFYDAHPYLYLMTPEQTYRVDLFAGVVVDYDAEIYQSNLSQSYLSWCMSHSRFTTDMAVPSDTDRILTLSTCSYEYANARFVVLGVLTPVE